MINLTLISGSLPCLMLDLGLLKISLGGVFFLFIDPADGSNHVGHYPYPFPNPSGQSYPSIILT